MDRLSDSVLSSSLGLSGSPLSSSGGAPPDTGAVGAGGDAPSFSAVLERVQDATAAPGESARGLPERTMTPVAGDLVGPADGTPAGSREPDGGRQEIAAAFAVQWAELVRGGAMASEGAVAAVPATMKMLVALGSEGEPVGGPGTVGGGSVLDGLVGRSGVLSASAVPADSGAWLIDAASPAGVSNLDGPEQLVQLAPPAQLERGRDLAVAVAGALGPGGEATGLSANETAEIPADPALTLPPVVAWQLSPKLAVITSADTAAAASDEALLAYAAGQGLDPAVLQRVFGASAVSRAMAMPADPLRDMGMAGGTVPGKTADRAADSTDVEQQTRDVPSSPMDLWAQGAWAASAGPSLAGWNGALPQAQSMANRTGATALEPGSAGLQIARLGGVAATDALVAQGGPGSATALDESPAGLAVRVPATPPQAPVLAGGAASPLAPRTGGAEAALPLWLKPGAEPQAAARAIGIPASFPLGLNAQGTVASASAAAERTGRSVEPGLTRLAATNLPPSATPGSLPAMAEGPAGDSTMMEPLRAAAGVSTVTAPGAATAGSPAVSTATAPAWFNRAEAAMRAEAAPGGSPAAPASLAAAWAASVSDAPRRADSGVGVPAGRPARSADGVLNPAATSASALAALQWRTAALSALDPLDAAPLEPLAAVGEESMMPAQAASPAAPAAVSGSSSPLVQSTGEASPSTARSDSSRPMDAQPLDLRAHLDQDREVLARRMGEALAARVLAQVERGEWQIRLSVAPQDLGPIDIDLQVQGNRMEAQFQVANSQTQSLIQDGMGRLREAVGASGMDLASVWVSGGWNERNRGNPTPGQPDGPVPTSLNEGGGDEQTVDGVQTAGNQPSNWTPRQGALDILI